MQCLVALKICPRNSDTFPHLIIRACSKTKMELSLSRIQGALATTTARATKMSLVIKMNARFFCFNIFAFISTLLKWQIQVNFPTEFWGPHPSSDSEKKLNLSLCVYVLAKQPRKRKFSVLFIQVVKKSALHVQNLLFFIYLFGSFPLTFSLSLLSTPTPPPTPLPSPVRRCSQDLSMCVNG